jgi:hypothetical protein
MRDPGDAPGIIGDSFPCPRRENGPCASRSRASRGSNAGRSVGHARSAVRSPCQGSRRVHRGRPPARPGVLQAVARWLVGRSGKYGLRSFRDARAHDRRRPGPPRRSNSERQRPPGPDLPAVRSLSKVKRPKFARDDMPEPLFRAVGTTGTACIVARPGNRRRAGWDRPVAGDDFAPARSHRGAGGTSPEVSALLWAGDCSAVRRVDAAKPGRREEGLRPDRRGAR